MFMSSTERKTLAQRVADSTQLSADVAGLVIKYYVNEQIYSTSSAFAAKLTDGKVVTWGIPAFGGDSSEVQEQLVDVQEIYSNIYAFAAVLHNRKVVTWGTPTVAGTAPKCNLNFKT